MGTLATLQCCKLWRNHPWEFSSVKHGSTCSCFSCYLTISISLLPNRNRANLILMLMLSRLNQISVANFFSIFNWKNCWLVQKNSFTLWCSQHCSCAYKAYKPKIFRENNLHFHFRPKSDFTDFRQYKIAINSVKLTFY